MVYQLDWRIDEQALGLDLARIDSIPATGVPWKMGVAFEGQIDEPIQLALDPDCGTDLPDIFLVGIPLFSQRAIDVLNAVGVTNFRAFDVVVKDERDGSVYTQYKAINIVGAFSCLDLDRSEYDPSFKPPMMEIQKIVLDPSRIPDLHLFRLAEKTKVILVSDSLKEQMEKAKLVGVRFVEVEL